MSFDWYPPRIKECATCGSQFIASEPGDKYCHIAECDKQRHEEHLSTRRARNKEANPDGKWHYKIKSCGKAHAHCGVCRPEIVNSEEQKQASRERMTLLNETKPELMRGSNNPGFTGHHHTEEAKDRQAEVGRNRVWTDESRRKLGESIVKAHANMSEEARQSMLEGAARGRKKGHKHTEEEKEKIGAAHKGRPQPWAAVPKTEEQRVEMSKRAKRHLEEIKPEDCNCKAHHPSFRLKNTDLEIILRELLLADFPEVVPLYRFGRFEVDAYLPTHKIAFEADGYWHYKKGAEERDARRDSEIFERFGVTVIRLSGKELNAIARKMKRAAA